MAQQSLRIWPDPCLSTPTQAVTTINGDTHTLVADLFDTLRYEHGIGLAANQIGVSQSVVVLNLDPMGEAADDKSLARELAAMGYERPVALINPKIIRRGGRIEWQEGCLSVPGVQANITRSARVEVAYHDQQGRRRTLKAKDLYAVCIQHELDHLLGRVFVEYLPTAKQASIRRALERKAS